MWSLDLRRSEYYTLEFVHASCTVAIHEPRTPTYVKILNFLIPLCSFFIFYLNYNLSKSVKIKIKIYYITFCDACSTQIQVFKEKYIKIDK